jgi:ATP-dependent DNA ligase
MSASRELHCQLNRVEPCLPRSARKPPAGPGRVHEIKHDGFRIIAVRDGARVRLLTRKGIDLARRFAQIAAAVAVLPVHSCIIDGEAIACDGNGLAVFELLRYRRRDHAVALCAFDLLELEGYDTRRTPIEERKGALAKLLGGHRTASFSASTTAARGRSSTSMPARSAARASCRSVSARRTTAAAEAAG